MKQKSRNSILTRMLFPVICVIALACFLRGLSNVSDSQAEEEKRRLEDAIRRSVITCYAVEGAYPPDLTYLEEHYGVQINRDRYDAIYQPIAQNLMPDITVVEQ